MSVSLLQKWQLLQAVIRSPALSATAKVVAARILEFHNGQTGMCCPSYQSLAEGAGVKRRAAINAVQELEKDGWIALDRVKGGMASAAGRYATNSIRIDFSRAERDVPTVHRDVPTVHGDAPSTVHGDALSTVRNDAPSTVQDEALLQNPNNARDGGVTVHEDALSTVHGGAPESTNISTKETTKDSPPTPSGFDRWWSAYPRRDGKLAARKAYDRAIKQRQATDDELLAGAERYAAARDGQDPQFTKLPTTWLNGGHWSDEAAPAHRPPAARGNARPSLAEAALRAGGLLPRGDRA